MRIPELESKVSYLEKELERTQQSLQAEKHTHDTLKQNEQQLIFDNTVLKQELGRARNESEGLERQKAALQYELSALEQQKSWFVQRVERKEKEVEQLNEQISTLKQMCTSLHQERAHSLALQQELKAKTTESVVEQRRLQCELSLKEEALQNNVRCLAEANTTIYEMEVASSQARADDRLQRMPEIEDHWKIARDEVQIQGEIGHGAWGHVAQAKFRGMKVAAKRMYEVITNPRNLERVCREIRTMASVRHPNLVLFIGAVLDEGPPIIVSELLDTNLRIAYERQQLKDLHTKKSILHGVACALNYLHKLREPIIHRDISAPNVLLKAAGGGEWTPKVSDFGSANLARYSRTLGEGAIIYAAPETYPNSHVPHTTKIDVYSYGVLIGELMTEEMPNPESLSHTLQRLSVRSPDFHVLMVNCTTQNPRVRPTMEAIIADYLEHMMASS